ncbi:B3 domain-containing transcription factor VRN1 [Linum perenne]
MASRTLPCSSSTSCINKPHGSFFRIIVPNILQQNKLKLPKKFVRRYGSEISSKAKLWLPNGYEWKVGVEKRKEDDDEEEVWLSDGWVEFMEHHSISNGFFLVFDYHGDSAFHVGIFDLTTCSISYQNTKSRNVHFKEEESSPNIIVISDDDDDQDDKDGEMEKTLERLRGSGILTNPSTHRKIRKMYIKCYKGIEEAVVRVRSTQLHPPSFIILLSSDQIRARSRPMIPISFVRQHIVACTSVVLEMGGGKQWSVRLEMIKSGKYELVSFGQGWSMFKEDNKLGEGDVCLFQLISNDLHEDKEEEEVVVVMDVSIFPAHH